MFTNRRGLTVARSHFARKIGSDNENTDIVVGYIGIPPGSTIQQIHVKYDAIGSGGTDRTKAQMSMLHGYILTDPSPYHGYGTTMSALDTMWDDRVPKDRAHDQSLSEQTDDSIAGNDTQGTSADTGAIESGTESSTLGGSSVNDILNLGMGPEEVFARIKRHTLNNSPVLEEGHFTPTDSYSGTIDKNYHIPRHNYGYLMFGFGTPRFEADTDIAAAIYTQDDQWLNLMYPELLAAHGLIDSTANFSYQADILNKHLEQWYVEADTWTDIDDANDNDNFTVYLDLTVQYRRPSWEGGTLNSR